MCLFAPCDTVTKLVVHQRLGRQSICNSLQSDMESVSETRVVLPAAAEAAALLRGAVEKFAFARAVSRLYEMQAPLFLAARPRHE